MPATGRPQTNRKRKSNGKNGHPTPLAPTMAKVQAAIRLEKEAEAQEKLSTTAESAKESNSSQTQSGTSYSHLFFNGLKKLRKIQRNEIKTYPIYLF